MKQRAKLNNNSSKSKLSTSKPLFLQDVDGRSIPARRFRTIYKNLIEQASAQLGGEANLSEAHKVLMRRAASMSLRCEVLDVQVARGEPIDDGLYVRLSNSIGRLMERVGLPNVVNAPPDETLEKYLERT